MVHRSSARWLAPLALAAATGLVVGVITSSLHGSSSTSPAVEATHGRPTTKARTSTTTATMTTTLSTRTYTVQSGDFLSTVSAKTGVSVERLRQLNPGLDANALRIGQRIRVSG